MKKIMSFLLISILILCIKSKNLLRITCIAIHSYGCSKHADCCLSPGNRVFCVDMKRGTTLPTKDISSNMCADRDPFNRVVLSESYSSHNIFGLNNQNKSKPNT